MTPIRFWANQVLLDHLAVDFVGSGWDVKKLLRLMVLSATYGQASIETRQAAEPDPDNRLLSHGLRRRLQAEFLREMIGILILRCPNGKETEVIDFCNTPRQIPPLGTPSDGHVRIWRIDRVEKVLR